MPWCLDHECLIQTGSLLQLVKVSRVGMTGPGWRLVAQCLSPTAGQLGRETNHRQRPAEEGLHGTPGQRRRLFADRVR